MHVWVLEFNERDSWEPRRAYVQKADADYVKAKKRWLFTSARECSRYWRVHKYTRVEAK